MKTQEVSKRGILDIIMCVNSVFVAIELKKDIKSKADDLQGWNMVRISEAGGVVILAYPENWDMVFAIVKDISEKGMNSKFIGKEDVPA